MCIFITPSDIDRKFFLTLKEFEEQQTLKHFNVMRIIMFKSFEPGEMKIVVRRDTIIESMWSIKLWLFRDENKHYIIMLLAWLLQWNNFNYIFILLVFMSRKGPKVGQGMLDFVEDIFVGVKSH